MESTGMVIDPCIFIEYLRAKDKKKTSLFKLPDNINLFISSVTLYELLMGATDKSKRDDVRLLTDDLVILPFDEEVSIKAAEIYHDLKSINKLIDFRDIFVAATCLVHKYPIKTSNTAHFSRIKNLKIC